MSEPAQSTQEAATRGGRIVALDGLRGCACLLVVIGHYFGEVDHGTRFLAFDWLGVDLFFCLSGFLIGGILMDSRDSPSYFATFYIRRGFRIFPIYYLTVTLVLLALAGLSHPSEPSFPAGVYYGYGQNIVMALTGRETPLWLMPTWTLCVEEQFYLLLPVILYLIPARWVLRALLVLIVSASVFRLALVAMDTNKLALFTLLPSNWDLLFVGVLGAWAQRTPALWSRLTGDDRSGLKAVILAGLGMIVLLALSDDWLGWHSFDVCGRFAVGVAFTGMVLLLASGAPAAARLRSPLLCFFGQISYGLYLIHQPVIGILHGAIFGQRPDIATLPQAAVTVLAIAVSIGLAYLSWTYFESPLVQLGHRWRYREAR